MDLVLSPGFRSALVNDAIEAAERKKKKQKKTEAWIGLKKRGGFGRVT